MTGDELAAFKAKYRPFAAASVGGCVKSALGRAPNTSGLTKLGYSSRASYIGAGTYFYRNEGIILLKDKLGVKFIPGKGCEIDITDAGSEGFQIVGDVLKEELEKTGVKPASGHGFAFTVSGVPMSLTGQRTVSSSSSSVTYSIKRR